MGRNTAQRLAGYRKKLVNSVKGNKSNILKLNIFLVGMKHATDSIMAKFSQIHFSLKTNPLRLGTLYLGNYINHEVQEFKFAVDYGKRLSATMILKKDTPVVFLK